MDSPQYYIGHNGTQLGPFPKEQVSEMLASGGLAPGDLCWFAGASGWLPLSSVFASSTPPPLPGNVPLPEGAFTAAYSTAQQVVQYAGFWRRFAAYLIDGIVFNLFSFVVGVIIGVVFASAGGKNQQLLVAIGYLIGIVTAWLYFSIFESSSAQATLGKRALSIIVTDYEGNRISFGRASGRFFGKIASGLILFFGYFMCGWTQKKQTLHDMIAGCLVRVK